MHPHPDCLGFAPATPTLDDATLLVAPLGSAHHSTRAAHGRQPYPQWRATPPARTARRRTGPSSMAGGWRLVLHTRGASTHSRLSLSACACPWAQGRRPSSLGIVQRLDLRGAARCLAAAASLPSGSGPGWRRRLGPPARVHGGRIMAAHMRLPSPEIQDNVQRAVPWQGPLPLLAEGARRACHVASPPRIRDRPNFFWVSRRNC